MNIPKLILGNLTEIRNRPHEVKELISIIYTGINAQFSGKLPTISDSLTSFLYYVVIGDDFEQMLQNWSDDYERSRKQSASRPDFASGINRQILQGIGKEGSSAI